MLSFCLAVSSVWAWATVKLQSKRNHKATLKRNKTKWLIILASYSHAQTETHPFLANPGRLATHALSSCKKTLSPFANCITKHFHSLSLHRCRLTPSLLSAMPFCLLIDGALVTGAHWLSSTHHRQMQPQKDRFAGTKVESNALQNETRTFKGVNCPWHPALRLQSWDISRAPASLCMFFRAGKVTSLIPHSSCYDAKSPQHGRKLNEGAQY